MSHRTFALLVMTVTLCVSQLHPADGASVEIFFEFSRPFPDAVAAGVPANAAVLNGFVTTDADILSIGKVLIESSEPLFNVDPPFGSDTSAPDPLWLPRDFLDRLYFDSWITTPGNTQLLGPGLNATDGTSIWGDLSSDGAMYSFNFARLTFPASAEKPRFSGVITVAGENGPESFPFSVVVPEPNVFFLCVISTCTWIATRHRPRLAS